MTWKEVLRDTWETPWFAALLNKARKAAQEKTVYPEEAAWFKALNLTAYEDVKIVILGQDPYHGKDQAMGLAFSVNKTVAIPPSLKNIYREIEDDLGLNMPQHGDLSAWARRGVLLLNTTLTVEASKPLSHRHFGWERFTDAVVEAVSRKTTPVVFMLWGAHARAKKRLLDAQRHLILEAPHPSPLSAHSGFFGCRHFSRANAFLRARGEEPVDFSL